jgi:hypothetical protein
MKNIIAKIQTIVRVLTALLHHDDDDDRELVQVEVDDHIVSYGTKTRCGIVTYTMLKNNGLFCGGGKTILLSHAGKEAKVVVSR